MPINLRALLEEMIERDASDLHLVAGERPKMRVDGDIVNSSSEEVMTPKDTLSLAYSVLTENQKKRFETESELDFSFGIQNLARFRGNCFKQRGCVSLVIRQITFNVRTFEALGLPAVVAQLADRPRGLVLVTGPTGSGQSTTLAAMIDKINKERKGHISTVEDRIEFAHRHHHRRLPVAPAVAGAGPARFRAGRGGHTDPAAARQGEGPRDGGGDHDLHTGDPRLDSRGEGASDRVVDAGREEVRHADAER